MKLNDYEESLLKMIEKFGPAISSVTVEKREEALQSLVMQGCATMTRNDQGQMYYIITNEGTSYLETLES